MGGWCRCRRRRLPVLSVQCFGSARGGKGVLFPGTDQDKRSFARKRTLLTDVDTTSHTRAEYMPISSPGRSCLHKSEPRAQPGNSTKRTTQLIQSRTTTVVRQTHALTLSPLPPVRSLPYNKTLAFCCASPQHGDQHQGASVPNLLRGRMGFSHGAPDRLLRGGAAGIQHRMRQPPRPVQPVRG